ncbi:MAG: cadherin-like domain-containing protein, partial [Thermodesulfovibrionales bacterium]|nr:cadherin-like domain-containing protein [Thermodesulfovibrionales bacterium]
GNGGTDTATVTVTVTAVNDAPVAQDQAVSTEQDTAKAITLTATDPDGDPLTYTLKSGPDGMEIDSMTGEVRWTVPEDFLGTADYAILAEDGSGGSSEITQSFRLTLEGQ